MIHNWGTSKYIRSSEVTITITDITGYSLGDTIIFNNICNKYWYMKLNVI